MKTKSILIVEDDLNIQNMIRLLLDFEGYTAFVASSFDEGMRKLESLKDEHRPCLIITDLMMPGDGWNLTKALQASNVLITIPMVAMSAAGDKPPGVPFIKKPFSIDDLLATVKKYCCLAN